MKRPSLLKKVFAPPHLVSMSIESDEPRYEPDWR